MRISRWLGLASAASLVATACGGGSQNSAPTPFAQADLVGDWRYSTVFHGVAAAPGPTSGWQRGAIRVSDAGVVSVLSSLDSAGNHPATLPSPWTIDSTGSFTAPPGSTVGFHGKLNSGRTFAAATATPGSGTSLWVFQKVVAGSSFGASDVGAQSWRYHEVSTGPTTSWEHGDAATDDIGRLTLTHRVSRAGPEPDAVAFARMSMASDGIVTVDTDASWSGTLSADKAVLVATRTANTASQQYTLQVALRSGPSFVQGDLAGRWTLHDLVASGNGAAGWSHSVVDVDASGGLTFISSVTNAGVTTTPGPTAFALATDGTVSRATAVAAKFHGTMAPSKDIVVRTDTVSTGIDYAALALWVK